MHTTQDGQARWHDLGTEAGSKLVSTSVAALRSIKEGFAGISAPGVPNFDDPRCRYEFCIFQMFWMWYVANSPRWTKAGVTKTFLDTYHKSSWIAMMEAGLVSKTEEGLRKWEVDLEKRFMAYKDAFDSAHTAQESSPPFKLHGTVGWLFATFLFPEQQPDPRLIMTINQTGHYSFQATAELFMTVESRGRT